MRPLRAAPPTHLGLPCAVLLNSRPLTRSHPQQTLQGVRCSTAAFDAGPGEGMRDRVQQGFDTQPQTSTIPTAEVVAGARPYNANRLTAPRFATIMVSPPQALASMLPANPLLLGASAIAAATAVTAAAARQMFKTSRADAEELLLEAFKELEHAGNVLAPAEAELQARAQSALTLAQAEEERASRGKPASRATPRLLESPIAEVVDGQQRQADAAKPAPAGISPSAFPKIVEGLGADRSSPRSPHFTAPILAATSPTLAPAAAAAAALGPAHAFPAPSSPWDSEPPLAVAPPPPPQQPSRDMKPDLISKRLGDISLTQLKCMILDIVYGTARGVNATLDQRGNVEELVNALESRNPSCKATDALDVLHGRWKLVYTTHTPTLLLLKAIQSVPLVDIGDVYQVVDKATLTAHNKIDLALPLAMSLRADSGLEVRTPHSFRVRLQRIGLDTYIQTPQLLVSLDVPDSIIVLGHAIDLEPLRRFLVQPMQSGVSQAQELLRRAASPDLELPALESNSLWMMTTYLDDTLRISRDDAGSTFVMLRDE